MVPDIPKFVLDQGFRYRVPPSLAGQVLVGSLVRVPFGGRRVRGYVIGLEEKGEEVDTRKLKEIRSLPAAIPVFTAAMVPSLRWAAHHYVAPLAGVLAKARPPNLPKHPPPIDLPSVSPIRGPLGKIGREVASGAPGSACQLVAGTGWAELVGGTIEAPLQAGKSVMVVAPSAVEAGRMAEGLRSAYGRRVVDISSAGNAALTSAWSRAATTPGLVLVGTMRVVWWPVRDLSMMVLLEDGRKGMKERRTPTVSAAALARVRASHERIRLVMVGRVPTVDTLSARAAITRVPGRLWPPVELVDRRREAPGAGLLTQPVKIAISSIRRRGGRTFVFTHRHGYAPAARCARCRSLRICRSCEACPDFRDRRCSRCQAPLGPCLACGNTRFEPLGAGVGRVTEELRRMVGDAVGTVDPPGPVMVGTERDLLAVPPVELVVVVDSDGMVRGNNYRSTEDAMAIMARAATLVRGGGAGRMMVQTADPAHPVHRALRRADPFPFLEEELVDRKRFGLPPCGEVMVVEVKGEADRELLDEIFEHATVYGPARVGDRISWMVQSDDLAEVKRRLRPAVDKLRDRGCQVRIDVDPRHF